MPKSKDTTSKTLKDTIADIDNHFGKGTVMRMGDRENLDIPSISTGSLGLDIALGLMLCLNLEILLILMVYRDFLDLPFS